MAMHQVDYEVLRSGSKLFDIVMMNAAKKLCEDLPGLSYAMDEKAIRITGELDDGDYEKYLDFMFGGEEH